MSVEIGQTISHYKILRKLGHGGMGDVYLAENTRLGLKVALKFLAAQLTRDEKAIKRLEHEARAVAELSHPNISRIYDIEEAEGHRFLVLEYLEGETLADRIQRGPLPIDETIRIGKALAEGLVHAHARGIVHRDIKAPNAMLTAEGGVKIMDFGLARMPDATRLTESGEWLGTVPNMSPEQASGTVADERSDLWSLGVVLYQCVTGRYPFEGDSAMAVISRIRSDPVAPPTSLRTGVPMDLDRVILRCLEKDPSLRYQTADDLLAELRRLGAPGATSMSEATTVATAPHGGPSRKRLWVALIAVVVVAAAVVTWRSMTNTEPIVLAESPHTATAPERPNWILVAEFEGPPDSPDLAVAARALVTAALERSQVVTPVSRARLKRTLQLAMKPDTTQVIGEVAREVAYRAGARIYVEGRVDRIMTGYSIALRASDSDSDKTVASVSDVAENEETFISTLDRLGRELRVKIGEERDAVERTLPFKQVFTPSLEAYKWLLRGSKLNKAGNAEAALEMAKRALVLDPDFAEAWASLGTCYWNLGFVDSAQVAWEEVLRRPDRMTGARHLLYQARYRNAIEVDYVGALKAYRRLLEHPDSNLPSVLSDMGITLSRLGRFEEALETHRREEAAQRPAPPDGILLNNQFIALMRLGRVEEARRIAETIDEGYRARLGLQLSLAASDWIHAESLAAQLANDLTSLTLARFEAQQTLASLAALRGEVAAATRNFESLIPETPSPGYYEDLRLAQMQLLIAAGQELVALTACSGDTTIGGLILGGIWNASQGCVAAAESCLSQASAKPIHERRRHQVEMAFLTAWVEAASTRWGEAINYLEQPTPSGQVPVVSTYELWNSCSRWLVAHCEEQRGALEDAAAGFQHVLSPRTAYDGLYYRGIFYSFAHHRLVLLYSKMGRVEDARRHWEIFEKTFTNPDPELVPMVEEARRALEEAEAKAAS